jgi:hypothetical protein
MVEGEKERQEKSLIVTYSIHNNTYNKFLRQLVADSSSRNAKDKQYVQLKFSLIATNCPVTNCPLTFLITRIFFSFVTHITFISTFRSNTHGPRIGNCIEFLEFYFSIISTSLNRPRIQAILVLY